jgi:two-component system, NarL family, sensor histidine kinase LiaS
MGGEGLALRISNVLAEPSPAVAAPGSDAALSTTELQLHLARELHDQVASPLISMVVELHELRAELGDDTDASQRVAVLEESARQALRQTREILIDLRGQEELRLNFGHVLQSDVLSRFESRATITLHISPAWPNTISGWSAFNLARIVHEALTNAVRHGRATSIVITLDVIPSGEAIVAIIDNGEGFDGVTGLGMAGMLERTVIIGGTFKSWTAVGGGTRVEVRIPTYRLE